MTKHPINIYTQQYVVIQLNLNSKSPSHKNDLLSYIIVNEKLANILASLTSLINQPTYTNPKTINLLIPTLRQSIYLYQS